MFVGEFILYLNFYLHFKLRININFPYTKYSHVFFDKKNYQFDVWFIINK